MTHCGALHARQRGVALRGQSFLRLAAMIADPGQIDMAEGMRARLGDLWNHVDDPAADDQFEALLQNPAMKTLFGPRVVTNGVSTVREYVGDMRRYTSDDQVATITCPSYITDNETDVVSTGQGHELYDKLTCPKEFRRFRPGRRRRGSLRGRGTGGVLDRSVRLAR